MPQVSIIVPVYNVEQYLQACLESIVNQTLKDIEIIIVNDGSTDNSPKIIEEFAQKDNRIKVINQENHGYGNAVNNGISLAKGEYVGIVETDDFIEETMFEELYNEIKKQGTDIIKSTFYDFYDAHNNEAGHSDVHIFAGMPDESIDKFTIYDYPQILNNHPSVWSCLYKKSFVDGNNIRFVETPGAQWVDYGFLYDTMLNGSITYFNKPFYHYRNTNPNQSAQLKDYNIPFDRWNDIWERLGNLDKEKFAKICEYTAFKEFNDLLYAYRIASLKNVKLARKRLVQSFNRMDENIVLNSALFDNEQKKIFKTIKKGKYFKYFFEHKLKQYRQQIISIRFNKDEKRIKILNHTLLLK